MPSRVPSIVFDGSRVPLEHHFEVFHDTTAPLFATDPLAPTDTFRVRTTDYLVDDVVVSRLRHGPLTLRRAEGALDGSTSEWVTVQVHLRGNLNGRAGDRALDLGPERIGIVDLAEPFSAWGGRTDVLWVAVPRSRLAHLEDRYGGRPLRSLHRSSPRGMVLGAAVERLWNELPHAPAEAAADLAAGIVETIDLALRAERYSPAGRDLRTAVEHYVAANLDDLDLGVDTLQRTFHCSRSALYRLFEPHGGVARYIREGRLVRCFDELSRVGTEPARVGAVATRWGFENPSHFHRVFVQAFGLPPSVLARRPARRSGGFQPDTGTAEQMAQFHRWANAGS